MKKFILLLFLIYTVACKKTFGDKLREKTDKYIFKEAKDADKRTPIQAATRDFFHGVYHTGRGIANIMKGRKKAAKEDFTRAKQHFQGENLHQIKRNQKNQRNQRNQRKHGGGGGHF